jgi:hypothetical protein
VRPGRLSASHAHCSWLAATLTLALAVVKNFIILNWLALFQCVAVRNLGKVAENIVAATFRGNKAEAALRVEAARRASLASAAAAAAATSTIAPSVGPAIVTLSRPLPLTVSVTAALWAAVTGGWAIVSVGHGGLSERTEHEGEGGKPRRCLRSARSTHSDRRSLGG